MEVLSVICLLICIGRLRNCTVKFHCIYFWFYEKVVERA